MESSLLKAMMLGMMTWVGQLTGLPVPTEPPQLRFIEPAALCELAGEGRSLCSEGREVLGLYDHERRTIYLRTNWRANDLRDASYLFHELVHYAQFSAGVDQTIECWQRLEEQAYEAQRTFLEQHGIPKKSTLKFMGMDPIFYLVLTHCSVP